MRIAITAIILLLHGAAHAETQVSLRAAVSLALDHDHRLKASGHQLRALREEMLSDRSRYFPKLTLEEAAAVTNSPTHAFMYKLDQGRFSLAGDLNHPAVTNNFRSSLTLEQPILDFTIGSRVEVSQAEALLQQYRHQTASEDVTLEVYRAYVEVNRAKVAVEVAGQAVKAAVEHRRLAEKRNANGVGLKSDELRARSFLAEKEVQRVRAMNDLRVSQLRLASVIGMDTGAIVDVTGPAPENPRSGSLDEFILAGIDRRPEVQERSASVRVAEAGVRVARNAWLPTLYGNATYMMNDRDIPFGRDNDAWALGATFRWELFDGFGRSHNAQRAEAQKAASEEYLAYVRRGVSLEIEEAWLRREEAEKRVEVAREGVAAAVEAVRLVAKRYENSLAPQVDLLDAQASLDHGRLAVAEAEAAASLATARLYHAAGLLQEEVTK